MDKIYNLELKTILPVHIGGGDEKKISLLSDYIIKGNRILFTDREKVNNIFKENERIMDDYIAEVNKNINKKSGRFALNRFLKKYKIKEQEFLSGREIPVKNELEGAEIKRCLMENGKAYIPGSAIKGAIKNAFAFYHISKKPAIKSEILENKDLPGWSNPFETYEKKIFGRDANNNIFRFLQVSDSRPFEYTTVLHLKRYNLKKNTEQAPVNYECIEELKTSSVRIIMKNIPDKSKTDIPEFWADWNKYSLNEIFSIVNNFSLRIAENEIEALTELNQHNNMKSVIGFYTKLKKRINESKENGNNIAYMPAGAGTGFFTKTIGYVFNDDEFESLQNRMRNSKVSQNFGWQKGKKSDKFPVTRLFYKKNHNEYANIGWILLKEEIT